MNTLRSQLLIFYFILILPGCLMVREGDLQSPAQWPLQPSMSGKKSISLNLSAASNQRAKQPIEDFREQATKAYLGSGLFSSVTMNDVPADISADITISEEGNEGLAFLSGFISGYTFTLIPGYASETVTARTSYTDRDNKVLANVEKKERLGFWIQFFLLFVMPFKDGPGTVVKDAHFDLHRATIDEAHAKGVL